MPALRESLSAHGFDEVRTYLQSGNVVARSDHRSAAKVALAVHDAIADDFGLDIQVVTRSARHVRAVVVANPFSDAAERPVHTHVIFLDKAPDSDGVSAFKAVDVSPDKCQVVGSEVYVRYSNASQASPVGSALRHLGVEGTSRNWRTVLALVELTGDQPG